MGDPVPGVDNGTETTREVTGRRPQSAPRRAGKGWRRYLVLRLISLKGGKEGRRGIQLVCSENIKIERIQE
jgi:hypothetical protein